MTAQPESDAPGVLDELADRPALQGLTRGIVWSDLVAEMRAERRVAPYEADPLPVTVLDDVRRDVRCDARRDAREVGRPDDQHRAA